jgi:hypothetical protein
VTPYYQDAAAGIVLYCGDCRTILPQLEPVDCVITDPVWPNSVPSLQGADDPAGLFAQAAAHFPTLAKRVVVQMGCDSDPRFLQGMPAAMPFFRACWLPYAVPSYKGRLLYSGDVAYAFGVPPPPRKGRRVIDGEAPKSTKGKMKGHPCARHLAHVRWLVSRFADGTILDPFSGIGTTLVAAKYGGYPAVGIEIEEAYCESAARRLEQGVLPFAGTEPSLPVRPVQGVLDIA